MSTPERVAFGYALAGLGSRFLAQIVDMAVLGLLFIAVSIGAAGLGGVTGSGRLALLVWILLSFLLLWGYFLVSEAVWSGQTLGKRAFRLRVVGDQGEPIRFSQSAIRNLVRIVDFLPVLYGLGLVTLFVNGRGKRLGDLAAGTIVVRERQRVSLYDLAASGPQARPAAAPQPSIWDRPSPAEPSATTAAATPDPTRSLEPALRRLVIAYAARRNELDLARRKVLASSAEAALRRALPDLTAAQGPLAALDFLAEQEGVTPARALHRKATAAMALGTVSFVSSLLLFIFPPVGLICGILAIVFGTAAVRAIRAQPHAFAGEDRAKTGRLLGILGLAVSTGALVLFGIAFAFRG